MLNQGIQSWRPLFIVSGVSVQESAIATEKLENKCNCLATQLKGGERR